MKSTKSCSVGVARLIFSFELASESRADEQSVIRRMKATHVKTPPIIHSIV